MTQPVDPWPSPPPAPQPAPGHPFRSRATPEHEDPALRERRLILAAANRLAHEFDALELTTGDRASAGTVLFRLAGIVTAGEHLKEEG